MIGESRAGAAFGGTVGAGECVRIYTGAPLPAGADAICPVEQLSDDGPDGVLLRRPASPADVRVEGGDFRTGEVVLHAGQLLTAPAGAGGGPRARAAERAAPPAGRAALHRGRGRPARPALTAGQVYDSNSVGLHAMLLEAGCEVLPLGHAPDSPQALQAAIDAAGGADVLLTSGGVSMGKYDFMRDLLVEQGRVSFWKVRMRPGGPAILGGWNGLPCSACPATRSAASWCST